MRQKYTFKIIHQIKKTKWKIHTEGYRFTKINSV